jgi:hypothetical protein
MMGSCEPLGDDRRLAAFWSVACSHAWPPLVVGDDPHEIADRVESTADPLLFHLEASSFG